MATEGQRQIAELYDALKREAEERAGIGAKQREVLAEFDVASQDQTEAHLKSTARALGALYKELLASGVDDETAMWITRDQADYMRETE